MLLARFFAWLDRALRADPAGEPERAGAPAGDAGRAGKEPLAMAALLSVDGGGQVLLCAAERLTLGHLRAGRADLGFLADVGALHAELERADSLQAGPGWRVRPLGGEAVTLEGRALGPEGRRIASGQRVRLGENLEFRLELPDPASASARVELQHGAECGGAQQLVLLAPGPGGRVRIGASLAYHVRVPGLEFELTLEWSAGELLLHSELPLAPGDEQESTRRLPFPPPARLAFTCGKPRGSRPPFGLSLEPVLRPRSS